MKNLRNLREKKMDDDDKITIADFLLTEFFFTMMQRTNTKSKSELRALKKSDPAFFRKEAEMALQEVTPPCRDFVIGHLQRMAENKKRQDFI